MMFGRSALERLELCNSSTHVACFLFLRDTRILRKYTICLYMLSASPPVPNPSHPGAASVVYVVDLGPRDEGASSTFGLCSHERAITYGF